MNLEQDELRTHQIELEMLKEALRRPECELAKVRNAAYVAIHE